MPYPQSTTYTIIQQLFLTGTNTPATGKTAAVTISKAGAAFANPSAGAASATEISGGFYFYSLSTTDTNTLGDLTVLFTATGCDVGARILPIVKATNGGLTALPDTAVTGNASLITSGNGTDQLTVAGGIASADAKKINGVLTSAVTTVNAVIGQAFTIVTDSTGRVNSFLVGILTSVFTETSVGYIAATFKQFFNLATPTSTANQITGVTTTTNLTNAPTAGDFTGAMKTSLNAATPTSVGSVTGSVGSISGVTFPTNFNLFSVDASGRVLLQPTQTGVTIPSVTTITGNVNGNVAGSVASVSGNVGGNVVGSVASVTAGVTIASATCSDATVIPTVGTGSNQIALASGNTYVGTVGSSALTAIGNAVWSSATRTLTSFGSLVSSILTAMFVDGSTNKLKVNSDNSVNISSSGTTVSVTVPAAAAIASQVPSLIPITTFNTLRVTLPVMGTITSRTSLIFTLKSSVDVADSAALIQISESGGLLIANGATASSSALGSLTVSDESAGTVNLFIDETITALLTATNGINDARVWDCKVQIGSDWTAPIGGKAIVTAGVGRTVS